MLTCTMETDRVPSPSYRQQVSPFSPSNTEVYSAWLQRSSWKTTSHSRMKFHPLWFLSLKCMVTVNIWSTDSSNFQLLRYFWGDFTRAYYICFILCEYAGFFLTECILKFRPMGYYAHDTILIRLIELVLYTIVSSMLKFWTPETDWNLSTFIPNNCQAKPIGGISLVSSIEY